MGPGLHLELSPEARYGSAKGLRVGARGFYLVWFYLVCVSVHTSNYLRAWPVVVWLCVAPLSTATPICLTWNLYALVMSPSPYSTTVSPKARDCSAWGVSLSQQRPGQYHLATLIQIIAVILLLGPLGGRSRALLYSTAVVDVT